MKLILFCIVFVCLCFQVEAQHKVHWKKVEIRALPQDTAYIEGEVVAEWLTESEGAQISELFPNEIKTIKKKAAKYGCDIAFVDVHKVHTLRKGQLYVLGVRKK